MTDINSLKTHLECIYYITTIIGIPVAITVFLLEKKREKTNRSIDVYLKNNDRYMNFLALTLEYPELKCGDFNGEEESLIESNFNIQQITLYEILIITLEQCYYLYYKNGLNKEKDYTDMWKNYMMWWASRTDFRHAWKIIEPSVDNNFMKFMENEFSKYETELNRTNTTSITDSFKN